MGSISGSLSKKGVSVRTFHSLGYEIVRKKTKLRYSDQSEEYRRTIMESVIKQCGIKFKRRRGVDPVTPFLDALSKAKEDLIPLRKLEVKVDRKDLLSPTKEEIEEHAVNPLRSPNVIVDKKKLITPTGEEIEEYSARFTDVFWAHIALQLQYETLDYSDMIYFAIRVLLDDTKYRNDIQNRFEYILVDEFQDLNESQLYLLQILSLPQNNVFIIGDDDQMIYGWRGAKVGNIIDFPERYPTCKDYTLSTNYRSSRVVVEHSKWLINHNLKRVWKDIKPKKEAIIGLFEICLAGDMTQQAKEAARWIMEKKGMHKGSKWANFAIIYRVNAYEVPIALVLDSKNIPHSPINEGSLFHSEASKILFAYLSVILEPEQATPNDFEDILKKPNKYMTNEYISRITDWQTFIEGISDQSLPPLSQNQLDSQERLEKFRKRITQLASLAMDPKTLPTDFLTFLNTQIGLSRYLMDQSNSQDDPDQASDEELLSSLIEISKKFESISAYFQYLKQKILNPLRLSNPDKIRDEVTLSTIHKTKGNEFPNVVYFNLNERRPPRGDKNWVIDEEEERRVAYVAVTRARENIFITATKDNYSHFLRELVLDPHLSGIGIGSLEAEQSELEKTPQSILIRADALRKHREDFSNTFPEIVEKKPGNLPIRERLFPQIRERKKQAAIEEYQKITKEENLLRKTAQIMVSNEVTRRESANEIRSEITFRKALENQMKNSAEFSPAVAPPLPLAGIYYCPLCDKEVYSFNGKICPDCESTFIRKTK